MVVDIQNVSKTYGRTVAVDRVNLGLEAGEFFGLLGPNGAGKSTLIHVMLGLIAADAGAVVRLFGREVTGSAAVGLRARVGVVGEAPQLRDERTAAQYLEFFARLYGLGTGGGARVSARLAEVGLAEAAHKSIKTYSRGMKQRLAIARALLHEPELLILDEPTGGLDPLGVHEVRELLQARNRMGTTVFLCSHLLSEVEKSCTRIAVIDRGRLAAMGATAEIAQGDLESAFLRLTREGPR